MLDIGWPELMIVALVTIIVVGPKELPRVLRTATQLMRKVRAMASEFQTGIDDLAREAELDDLKKSIEKTASTDIVGELENEIDPTGEVNKSVQEMEASLNEDPRSASKSVTDSSAKPETGKISQDGADAKPAPARKKKKAGGKGR